MSIHAAIDTSALGRMQSVMDWHIRRGARLAHLPWTSSALDVQSTKPRTHGEDIPTPHGFLVASGEQSFTRLARDGKLDGATRWIGWTPCFRNEPEFDDLHHYYFIKAELFSWIEDGKEAWEQAFSLARLVSECLDQWAGVDLVMGDSEIDLMAAGIEVGSAGVRVVPGQSRQYVYCTALAEPRFGKALDRIRRRE